MVKKSCAINLKKGEERASMSECLDRRQVKYYGIEKVDRETIKNLTASKMSKAQRNKLILQVQSLKRKIMKGKEEYKKLEGDNKKKKLEELKKMDKLRSEALKMLKKFDEEQEKQEKEKPKPKKQNKGVDLEDKMSKRLNEMRKQQKKSKEKAKKTQQRVNPWLEHVKQIQKENKQMAYKDVLKKAKQTYNNKSVKSELKLKNCDMKKVKIPCNYKNKKMNSYVELIKSLQQKEKEASTRKQKEGLKKTIDKVKKQFLEYLKQLPKKKISTPSKTPPKIPPELPDYILEQEFPKPKIPPELPDYILEQEFPKPKPKAKPRNLFNEFKKVMKELINLIYDDEIYIFYNPNLSDKWNESAVKQHKKNLIMVNVPKSLNINELYYDNETYPFEKLSRSFLNLLKQPSVKNSLSLELKEDVNKVKKLINIINKELQNKMENESEDEREEEEDLYNFSDLSGSKRKKLDREWLETIEIIKPSKKKQGVSKKEQVLDDIIKKTEARLKEMKQERIRSKDSAKTAQQRVNPWLEHVKQIQKENKEMAYKDVLKKAKKTYKPKEKPKEETKKKAEPKKQPTNNIIEKFKNNMKKLIDIIYHPNIYEYYDPNRADDEERDKELTKQHKKDLFIDFKSFSIEELFYADDEYEYSKYRERFRKGLLNKTVKEELKKNKNLNEKVKKLNDLLQIIDQSFEELMEKEGEGYDSDDE